MDLEEFNHKAKEIFENKVVPQIKKAKMKQTAVEFLLSHIWTTDWVNYTREEKINVINQAKAIEKEQIINAASWTPEDGLSVLSELSEQYYNKTFKSE